jgi:hypothetical protein
VQDERDDQTKVVTKVVTAGNVAIPALDSNSFYFSGLFGPRPRFLIIRSLNPDLHVSFLPKYVDIVRYLP